MSLTLKDLPIVFEELHEVRKKWYEIGLQLKVEVEDLETILSENKNDQNVCLRRILMIWLKSGNATWSSVCSVLTNRTIDERVLEKELRRKYLTEQLTQPCQEEKVQTQERSSRAVPPTSLSDEQASAKCSSKSDSIKSPKESQESTQAKKNLKRASETPVPSAIKVTKIESGVKLPDSLSIEIFARRPTPDHYCMKCNPSKVPLNPQRTLCCNKLYCEPCSKKTKKCTNRKHHKQELRFSADKDLKDQIVKLKLKSCCNPGCDWSGGEVYKLKSHLPQCTYATKRGQKKKEQSVEVPEVTSSNNTSKARAERSNSLASELPTAPLSADDIQNLRVEEVYACTQAVFSPPVNLIMNQASLYQGSTTIWKSAPFISHQLGYELNLVGRFDPNIPNHFELALGSALNSQSNSSHLKYPCIGDATVKILNPAEDGQNIKLQMGFNVTAEPVDILKFPEGGSFTSIPEQYVYEDNLYFQVVSIHLDEKYKPWLLHPTNTHDSDSDIFDCSAEVHVD